ncbi:MAG: hypothetical protein HOB72_24675 [Rhodospirillaceae bacterium]|nr:hypothetical protein [Rhodospirillaceae bacterium]
MARFYPARSWENPAATVDQFVTAVLRRCLVLKNDDKDKVIDFNIYPITKIGQGVLSLGSFQPNIDYIKHLAAIATSQDTNVTQGDVTFLEDGRGNVINEVPI